MKRTFGEQPTKTPPGMLRAIHWPILAELDQSTNEGQISRILESEGGTVRDLPRTAYHQFAQASGHDQAPAFGNVHEVTFNEDEATGRKWLSGKGYVLDDETGRRAALQIMTKVLFHNSVDLSEIKVALDFIEEEDDYSILARFTSWALAATTSVGKPAFSNAHSVIPDEIEAALATVNALEETDPHELVASLTDAQVEAVLSEITASGADVGPLEFEFAELHINFDAHLPNEIVASGSTVPAWEHFHLPEPDGPTPWFVGEVDENGNYPCWGHLGTWESCHDGYEAQCVMIPRPSDSYASFNQPGVITDRGPVETGPIFFRGGHAFAPDGDFHKAYGATENGIADMRVTAGVFGPWSCGVIRPGSTDEQIYAARASRISGHWKAGKLRAIVCVNSEGYNVPGSGEIAASMAFTTADGEIDELVASFPPCAAAKEDTKPSAWDWQASTVQADGISPNYTFVPGIFTMTNTPTEAEAVEVLAPASTEAQRLALELELGDDDE